MDSPDSKITINIRTRKFLLANYVFEECMNKYLCKLRADWYVANALPYKKETTTFMFFKEKYGEKYGRKRTSIELDYAKLDIHPDLLNFDDDQETSFLFEGLI